MIVVAGPGEARLDRWVGALAAASGRPTLGEDSDGYAHPLAEGIWFGTNPDPATRRYLFPSDLAGHLGWMTPAGLARSDPAYLERVVLAVCDWRRAGDLGAWLAATYRVLVDAATRGTPTFVASSEDRGDGSPGDLAAVLGFLGAPPIAGPLAFPRLDPARRGPVPSPPGLEAVADELFRHLHHRRDLPRDLVERVDAAVAALPHAEAAAPTVHERAP